MDIFSNLSCCFQGAKVVKKWGLLFIFIKCGGLGGCYVKDYF